MLNSHHDCSKRSTHILYWGLIVARFEKQAGWLKSFLKKVVLVHVNIITTSVCAVQLPSGHAVLHGFLKVSLDGCTQHTAISLRRERNLSILCSHSALVTQALSGRRTHTVAGKLADKNLPLKMNQRSDQQSQVFCNAAMFVSLLF